MRQTAILHHRHPARISTHAGHAVRRLMSSTIGLGIIHHGLRLLLVLGLLVVLLLLLVGVVMGLKRTTIGVEG
jgi:hypothetical protein